MKQLTKNYFNLNELQAAANQVLEEAKRLGADQAEITIETNKGFSVNAHDGSVETVEYNLDKAVDIVVFFGNRTGSASLSDIRKEALHDAVEAACHIAKFTDVDPASGLADKSELAFNYPHLSLAYPWSISVSEAIDLACECEAIARKLDKRILSAEEVRVATGELFSLYANSLGFVGHFPSSHHEISCVLVAKDKEEMQRDYSYTLSSDPKRLESINQLAEEAVTRTVGRLGARRVPTMRAPVIFAAEEARGLIGHFAAAIQGSNIYRKTSFLLDHIQKPVFPKFINIFEQPHLLHALGSAPFDEDGVLTRPNKFIDQGVLQHYALGVYSARKLNMKTTGNAGGVHNLTVSTGDKNLNALIKSMDKGLLVTELMGQGVNIVTGDYSRGAGGFWIENGEIQYPVHEITVAGNLKDIYANIVEIGNDVDERGNVRTGSILISEMMIAGN